MFDHVTLISTLYIYTVMGLGQGHHTDTTTCFYMNSLFNNLSIFICIYGCIIHKTLCYLLLFKLFDK